MNSIETLFPLSNNTWDLASGSWTRNGNNRYDQKTVATLITKGLYYENTIDMSAFFVQDKTFFFRDLNTQSPGLVTCGPTAADWASSASLQVLDIITSVPILGQTLMDALVEGEFPGMSDFAVDQQFIVYGNYRVWSANSTSSFEGNMQQIHQSNFGGGLPTAADKLYCYRCIIPNAKAPLTNNASLIVPATRYNFAGVAEDEGELSRIYRLRQSYEQKQG